jgi:catechol 2,3-dioxygenase-like lactoylglutathione lyase family enzyme
LKIDHVSIAWSDLSFLQTAFEGVGLKTEYGGVHSNGVTHMSILGFNDGSYIELISVIKPGQRADTWGKQIAGNGGPCAWAVEEEKLAAEVERIKQLGIRVDGPADYERRRPDGVLVEWQLAFPGDQEPGATLPFLIKDKTPRGYRVKSSQSVASTELIGVTRVIIAVKDLEKTAKLFRKVYGWNEAARSDNPGDAFNGASMIEFGDSPVILASPIGQNSWLGKRLEQFGDSPCSFLIGSGSIPETQARYRLEDAERWIDGKKKVVWIPSSKLGGIQLGFIGS